MHGVKMIFDILLNSIFNPLPSTRFAFAVASMLLSDEFTAAAYRTFRSQPVIANQ